MATKSCCIGAEHEHKACGPGYATPLDAMTQGPREALLYVVVVQPNYDEPHGDYLATIDVDPQSATYCQVIHRTYTQRKRQELHHSGWNACSSCYHVAPHAQRIPKRDKLVLPALNADTIYVVDVATEPRKPTLSKIIEGSVLRAHDVTAPHTAHCLANGNVMISIMGDAAGNAKGDFILFDANFDCLGTWVRGQERARCGYDFWYQPYFDVMIASEWGPPKLFRRGYDDADLVTYGSRLNVYKWSTQTLQQTLELGFDGITPLELRFMHNPKRAEGYVGCGVNANVYYFKQREDSGEFVCSKVIDIPAKLVDFGDGKPPQSVGGMMTDIVLSLDDKYLYVNCWRHGDVRQYDITQPEAPQLLGQIFLGGAFCSDLTHVKLLDEDKELTGRPGRPCVQGRRLVGGPQMMQLSLDGKRLYVSNSLTSCWDKQFYPDMIKYGGHICQLDVNTEHGGLTLNEDFFVDFGKEPHGPTLPHEMRFPGGDCTSDIWLAQDK